MRKVAAGAARSEQLASANPGSHGRDSPWPSAGNPRTQPLEQVLTRNVESAERTYDTAMQRYVVSQVDSRASQANRPRAGFLEDESSWFAGGVFGQHLLQSLQALLKLSDLLILILHLPVQSLYRRERQAAFI